MRTSSSASLPRSVARSSSRSKWVKTWSGKEEPGSGGRDGEAEAGQVVQLSRHPRERRLPAVVGAGDHDDPLLPGQPEVVTDHVVEPRRQLGGERQVKRPRHVGLLIIGRHLGIAELQSCGLQRADEIKVGEVELNLTVESGDGLVFESAGPSAEDVERSELSREQPRHPVSDPFLDVVHLRPVPECAPIVLSRLIGELRERRRDVRAEVGLALVPGDGDTGAPDVDAIRQPVQALVNLGRLGGEGSERG